MPSATLAVPYIKNILDINTEFFRKLLKVTRDPTDIKF
jgi:hypothetical protein